MRGKKSWIQPECCDLNEQSLRKIQLISVEPSSSLCYNEGMKVTPREVKRKKVVTWSSEIRRLQKKLRLSPLQEAVLIGTVLGDGSLITNAYGKNYRLHIEHRDKLYVDWKYRIFKDWCLSGPRYRIKTRSWVFRTISHPAFTKFREIFYKNKKKIVPRELEDILKSPLSLAVWFMDDGGRLIDRKEKKGRGYLLNVQQFSLEEVELIQRVLRKNFALSSTRQWNNTGYRLYFGRRSRDRLEEVIRKYILPSFFYKLSLDPVETQLLKRVGW